MARCAILYQDTIECVTKYVGGCLWYFLAVDDFEYLYWNAYTI